ncbi:hypothetical protein [Neobacillus bataviensis]|uniref:hypothetical protein n=1 Tax=Neobacillus bataviensis TaxID=220685 RepID=UPI001CC07B2F|nr:hypothetical protein [Neobacillus bataviensis]
MEFKKASELSRKYLANPHQNKSFLERLKNNNSIDLRDNCYVIDLGNGYNSFKPIDKSKYFE